jgi:hypothetical protein
VSAAGHRCESRTRLEFDHVTEFVRGGEATTDGIRLRCRAHNQYTAEQTFGAAFMREKRDRARDSKGAKDVSDVPASTGPVCASEPPDDRRQSTGG